MQTSDRIEGLRLILERQQVKTVTREEALEIGESLVSFYETLAEDCESIPGVGCTDVVGRVDDERS
jgi:hypothetical protein